MQNANDVEINMKKISHFVDNRKIYAIIIVEKEKI